MTRPWESTPLPDQDQNGKTPSSEQVEQELPRHARRVTVIGYEHATPWDPDQPGHRVYGRDVQSHDPYRAHDRRYDILQFPTDRELDAYDGPVRILAVVDRYPPAENAGAEWMLHHLLRDSVRRGHEAIVCTAATESYFIEGVSVMPRVLMNQLAAEAHVVVGHLMWTRDAVETAGTHRRPLIYLVHNDQQLRHWRLTPNNITATLWNSEWIALACGRTWGGPSSIVRPPVLIDDYALARDPWDAPFVTLVNPNPEKGSGVFYALADGPPARRYLTVEGAWGDQQLPGKDHQNVEWQPQTGHMVEDVYTRTRVLLVPSRYESWGRVAIEAMCSGIPVIAHPTPGLQEALGSAGIFRDRDDIDGWRQALALLDDRDFYRAQSLRCAEHAAALTMQSHADFDVWDKVVRDCAALRIDYAAASEAPGPVKTHAVA